MNMLKGWRKLPFDQIPVICGATMQVCLHSRA